MDYSDFACQADLLEVSIDNLMHCHDHWTMHESDADADEKRIVREFVESSLEYLKGMIDEPRAGNISYRQGREIHNTVCEMEKLFRDERIAAARSKLLSRSDDQPEPTTPE